MTTYRRCSRIIAAPVNVTGSEQSGGGGTTLEVSASVAVVHVSECLIEKAPNAKFQHCPVITRPVPGPSVPQRPSFCF